MNIGRLLLSLPLKRQTVVGALIITTVLFIIYQFTFVAELNESSKPQKNDVHRDSKRQQAQRKQSNEQGNIKKHPRDVKILDGEVPYKAKLTKGNKGNDNDKNLEMNQIKPPKSKKEDHEIPNEKAKVIERNQEDNMINSARNEVNKHDDELKKESRLDGKFRCEKSGKVISVKKINDDYCDCPEDGSDEPRTNACNNGRFTCIKYVKPFPEFIPSGWVNDGVCDCCDGSDEWKVINTVAHLPLNLQRKLGLYVPPCPDQCSGAA